MYMLTWCEWRIMKIADNRYSTVCWQFSRFFALFSPFYPPKTWSLSRKPKFFAFPAIFSSESLDVCLAFPTFASAFRACPVEHTRDRSLTGLHKDREVVQEAVPVRDPAWGNRIRAVKILVVFFRQGITDAFWEKRGLPASALRGAGVGWWSLRK